MASPGRLSSRARSHLLDDLDFQPVREMRARVLNDVPHIPTVPSPRVKFNFVDVSFPKQPECSGIPEAVPGNVERMACESRRRKNYESDRKENRDLTRDRERYDKENKCSNIIQRHEDRHEFMTQLLKKGVPVWEEVSEEERRMKIIGGTNPFKHLPRQTIPNPPNITLRNSNKNQKSSKVPTAVWEDVPHGSMNSYPLRPDENLDSSLDSVRSKDERLHDHEDLVSEVPKSSSRQGLGKKHQSQVQQSIKQDKTQVQNSVLQTHIQDSHSNQPITSPVPYKTKNDYFPGHSSSSEHSPERCSSQQNDACITEINQTHVQETHFDEHDSQSVSEKTGYTPTEEPGKAVNIVPGEERHSRPVMKRIHGGRIEDNGVTEYISWWPGDEPMRERGMKGEEEKHEREPTKESRSKRDLSAPSSSTAQPPKRQHKLINSEEVELEKPAKTPPRVRKYEQAEVRKYMEAKRSERFKSRKEEKQQQELEKMKREERLKELAVKTKQLAPCRKIENLATTAAGDNNSGQIQSNIKDPVNWGCSDSSEHEISPEIQFTSMGVQFDYQAATVISQKTEDARQVSEVNPELCKEDSRSKSTRKSPEKGSEVRGDSPRKRKGKDTKKKHKRKPISDSDSISDIVSRTVEECEKQVKSSRVSLESLSSLSASVSSSDCESKDSKSSVISSIDLTPKQRVVSLDRMAQRLTSRITEEENNLRHCLLNERGKPVINAESSVMSKIPERRGEPSRPAAGPGTIKDQISRASALKVPLSYSEIEALSVEELIAKMTAMLPNTSGTQGESYANATNQGNPQNQKNQEGLINKINIPEENKKGRLPQNQNQVSREKPQLILKEIPKLVPPDTPVLQLSGGGTIIIGTDIPISYPKAENLSPLPGYNTQQINSYVKGKIRKENRGYTNKMPVQKKQHVYAPSPFHFQKHNTQSYSNIPGVTDSIAFVHKKKMEKAALVIQAAYKGHRVRRITNSLLKKQDHISLNKRDKVQHAKQVQGNTVSNTGFTHVNFLKHDYISRPLNDVDLDDTSSNEEINANVDWQKIRAELESRTFKPKGGCQYTFQRPDLPEWVKPYFVLSETGDIEGFIGSRGKELGIQHWITANEKNRDAPHGVHIEKQSAVSSNSDKKNLSMRKSHRDVTLTEGLLSELDDSHVSVHEKETQTGYINERTRLKSINEAEGANTPKQCFISEGEQEFVDLRKTFAGNKLLVMQTPDNMGTKVNIGMRDSNLSLRKNHKTETEYASPSWSSQEDGTGSETLEEGPLQEMLGESSSEISGNHTVEVNSSNLASSEDGLKIESSGKLQSSNMSDSVDIEEVSAPHQLLGPGLHFAPASLRLRVNAELMYQDTLGEALNQLNNVEQLNIIANSRQEALALSRCLTLQQEESKSQQKNQEDKKKEEIKRKEKTRKEEKRWKEEQEEIMKEEFRKQKEALQNVERMEREARDRFAQLEKDVRARAEQVFSNAAQRAPLASNSQPDVIAAAAVAAVGATISQWELLKPVQRSGNAGLEFQNSVILNNGSSAPSFSGFQEYSTSFTGTSNNQSRSKGSQDQKSAFSEAGSLNNKKKLSSLVHPAAKISVEDHCKSEAESSNDSLSECIVSENLSNSSTKHKSTISSHTSVKEALSCTKSFSNKSESDVTSDYTEAGDRVSVTSVPEEVSSRSSRSRTVSHGKSTNMLRSGMGKNIPESVSVKEDILASKSASLVVSDGAVVSAYANASADTINSEAISASEVGEIVQTHNSSVPSISLKQVSSAQGSSVLEDVSESQPKEILSSEKSSTRASSTSAKTSSKPHKLFKGNDDDGVSDAYSESFEMESASDGSSTSVASQLRGRNQRDKGDLLLVPSSNILNQLGYRAGPQAGSGAVGSITDGGGESALGNTLNLVESLQKEEEVRHKHQKALLKLQEQSLIEEAKWKLAALQSEGGISMRKRQRAVLLQLREQRTHLRRLIETQNIAAQQRRLMLLQHHHLLATTTSLSSAGGRGLLAISRGHSPGPGSPRLTPRLLEVGASSSSDAQEDISFNLLLKGRENGSSSPSEGGGWEKRRSHSEERKRIASIRMQEKRRAAEVEVLQQQLLHEEREILRLKNKSPYESHEKDSNKSKRKGDFITIRSRDKRDKSPTAISPLSVLVQSRRASTETSDPEESIDASTKDSQSSIPEGGNESISHSDITSSISEHEHSTCRSHQIITSVPIEITDSKKSSIEEIASERQLNTVQSSIAGSSSSNGKGKGSVKLLKAHADKDSKITDNSISIKTVPSDETISTLDKESSIKTITGEQASKSCSHQLDSSEKFSHTPVLKSCSARSEILTRVRSDSIVSEELVGDLKSRTSGSSRSGSEHASGTAARSSSAKSCETRSSTQKSSSNSALPLPLRVPLSPRSPHRQHRRYSSESDDSFTLSQTETASDISDGEGKLIALREQLAARRAEADKLKKEKRRLRRERLASQEHALRQQISTYDAYIQQARMELEKESKEFQQASSVRPVIKKPQVAETKKSKLSESILSNLDKLDVSDVSLVSEEFKSDHSCSSKSGEIKSNESLLPKSHEIELVLESQLHQPVSILNNESKSVSSVKINELKCEEELPSVAESSKESSSAPQDEEAPSKTPEESSISEEYSFEDETISEHSLEVSSKKTFSRDSSLDTDHTASQASSTETIVHSPKKVDLSQKDGDETSSAEIGPSLPLSDITEDKEGVANDVKLNEVKETRDNNLAVTHTEGEKKLDIFIPTPDTNSREVDESTEQSKDTSVEESIGEEIAEDIIEEVTSEKNSEKLVGISSSSHHSSDQSKHNKDDSSQSLSISGNKETSAGSEDSPTANDKMPYFLQEPNFTEHLEKEENNRLQLLDKQRLVDDISNNIFSSMMKDTALLFTEIIKGRNSSDQQSQSVDDFIPLSTPQSVLNQIYVGDEQVDASETKKLHQEVEESRTSHKGPESLKEDDYQEISEELHDTSKSSRSESSNTHSSTVQCVNEPIADDGLSSCLPSPGSPQPMELKLTPQLTFDSSPNTHSPTSPTPTSPLRESKNTEMEPVSETASPPDAARTDDASISTAAGKNDDFVLVTAGIDDATIPAAAGMDDATTILAATGMDDATIPDAVTSSGAAAVPSQVTKEDSEDQPVSPSHDVAKADAYSLDMMALTNKLLNLSSADLDAKLDQLGADDTEFTVEGIEGDWFDDDFWTSTDNRKKQQQLKAEEERIAAEIARLEELQQLQEQYPGLVIREVPNKPPPPYTPPLSSSSPSSSSSSSSSSSVVHRLSKADQRNRATEVFHSVPYKQEEVIPIISDFLECLYVTWESGFDPGDAEVPRAVMSSLSDSQDEDSLEDEASGRIFRQLLFSLVRELLSKAYQVEHAPVPPPWLKQALPPTRVLFVVRTKSREVMYSHVQEQIKVLFGWKRSPEKETLLVRWARKHRDLVDQVLVKELQAEESSWTQYDEDEAAVKTQVACEIFDSLIEETVTLVTSILARKMTCAAH
nr:uncharacterized protein LOC123766185 isoform X4 [Procambarus clarkii]